MRLAPEVVTLTQAMAKDNVLWGVERIRGELLKLGICVSKRTIRKYMRPLRPTASDFSCSRGQVCEKVVQIPILGGFHHDYQYAA